MFCELFRNHCHDGNVLSNTRSSFVLKGHIFSAQVTEAKAVAIEKPVVKDIAYIPKLEEGVVTLTPQQEAQLTQQVSNTSL